MLSPLVKSRLLHRWRWQKWDKQIFLQWSVWNSGPENNPPLLPLQTRSAWPRNQSNSAMAEIPHDMHCKTEYNITNKQPFRTFQLGINYLMTQTRVFILRAGHTANLRAVRISLSSWFVHLEEGFSYWKISDQKGCAWENQMPPWWKLWWNPPLKLKISTSLNRGLDQSNCNQTKINIQGQLVVSCVRWSNSEKTCFHMNINLTLTSENASRCMLKPTFSWWTWSWSLLQLSVEQGVTKLWWQSFRLTVLPQTTFLVSSDNNIVAYNFLCFTANDFKGR